MLHQETFHMYSVSSHMSHRLLYLCLLQILLRLQQYYSYQEIRISSSTVSGFIVMTLA